MFCFWYKLVHTVTVPLLVKMIYLCGFLCVCTQIMIRGKRTDCANYPRDNNNNIHSYSSFCGNKDRMLLNGVVN